MDHHASWVWVASYMCTKMVRIAIPWYHGTMVQYVHVYKTLLISKNDLKYKHSGATYVRENPCKTRVLGDMVFFSINCLSSFVGGFLANFC